MASPKSGSWWVLWVWIYPWFVRAPKCSNYTLTNLLFGLCRFVWIIDLLVNLLSPHPRAPTRPFIPKMLWIKRVCPIPSLFVVFTFKTYNWVLKRAWGCVIHHSCKWHLITYNRKLNGFIMDFFSNVITFDIHWILGCLSVLVFVMFNYSPLFIVQVCFCYSSLWLLHVI